MPGRKVQPVGGDGYQWAQDVISNPGSWTLIDPAGHKMAHVYRADDRTWTAVWDDGEVLADGFSASGPALRAVEDAARPCAYVDTHASHGIVPCDNQREPGTMFCQPHQLQPDITQTG